MKKRPDNDTILKVITAKGGNIAEAAKAMNVNRRTVYRWMENDEELADGVEDVKEGMIDFSESQLMKRIKGSTVTEVTKEMIDGKLTVTKKVTKKIQPSDQAIIFFLKTRGKSRGYVERQEIAGSMEYEMPPAVIYYSESEKAALDAELARQEEEGFEEEGED